ncbi:MAG: hypothetical protein BMS9Abin25_0840 [Gammaproteobacteria bacterium]|nr:MAG: hypothetical protein BMS9Abin25_0840 [Gammaproteobacteria bacterium]
MVHIKLAPNVEFQMEIEIEGVTDATRDYDLQQHKAEIYAEFEKRIASVFPEGFKINFFEFGLDSSKH